MKNSINAMSTLAHHHSDLKQKDPQMNIIEQAYLSIQNKNAKVMPIHVARAHRYMMIARSLIERDPQSAIDYLALASNEIQSSIPKVSK